MPPATWELANATARPLGLSTSQFLSRLVAETSGVIGQGPMLGLAPLGAAASGSNGFQTPTQP